MLRIATRARLVICSVCCQYVFPKKLLSYSRFVEQPGHAAARPTEGGSV